MLEIVGELLKLLLWITYLIYLRLGVKPLGRYRECSTLPMVKKGHFVRPFFWAIQDNFIYVVLLLHLFVTAKYYTLYLAGAKGGIERAI